MTSYPVMLQTRARQARRDAACFDALPLPQLAQECRLDALALEVAAGEAMARSLLTKPELHNSELGRTR